MARIDKFLMRMAESGASDVHLTATLPPMLRVNGTMMKLEGQGPLSGEQIAELLAEIMPERNREQFEATRDTDFGYAIEGGVRLRINVFEDRLGVGAVMRVIPSEIQALEALGAPAVVKDFCSLSKGLVVVTGPTGSGKSTTLAAMVDHMNRTRTDHVITVEDPIEFQHPSQRCLVNQREVGVHTRGFKPALRAALREDPDIVLVGEMRDHETISTALETVETGHLVLGTLHTTTAASTVDRIIDIFPPEQQHQVRTMLAASLKGVVAQALLRRRDGKGRVAAFEVLTVTPAVAHQIREGKAHAIPSAIQTGGRHGMVSLNDAIVAHVRAGRVAPEEGYLKAIDRQELVARYTALGIRFDPSALAAAELEESGPAGAAGAAAAGAPRRRQQPGPKAFDDFESYRANRLGRA